MFKKFFLLFVCIPHFSIAADNFNHNFLCNENQECTKIFNIHESQRDKCRESQRDKCRESQRDKCRERFKSRGSRFKFRCAKFTAHWRRPASRGSSLNFAALSSRRTGAAPRHGDQDLNFAALSSRRTGAAPRHGDQDLNFAALSSRRTGAAPRRGDPRSSISLFGDEKYPPNFKHFEYANKNAPKNGVLKLGVEGTFNSLNPFILKGIAASGIDYIYDSLMQSSDDEISSYYPLIADSVALAADKYSISFSINKKAKWSDGAKIKADDVIFTFNILRELGHPSFKIAYQDVDKVVKINDYEVKFLFKTNKNKDLPMLLASMKILPKHYYQNHKFDETNLEKPLGSGPYIIKFVDQGKTIIYQREKNYWAKDLPVNVGRYNFDEIKFDYYRDANVLIEAFKAGNFDIRQENVARNWANSYNIDKVQNGEIIKREVAYNLPSSIQTFILNLRREKFQDKEFRKSLNYAFNFEWLKKHIFYNSYNRTNSYFENSDFAYKNFRLPISDENDFGRKNLIIAKKILDDAGYKVKNGKLISPHTQKPISLEFLISSQNFEMIIAPFVKNLQKLGIDAKIKFIEENQYEARLRNFDYDIIVGVFGQNSPPSSELIRYFHSAQADIKGSQNYLGLKNKQIDDLVEKISKAQNKQELQFLCQKFDKIMLKNYYTILQWHNDSYRILYKNDLKMPQKLPKYGLGVDFWWKE